MGGLGAAARSCDTFLLHASSGALTFSQFSFCSVCSFFPFPRLHGRVSDHERLIAECGTLPAGAQWNFLTFSSNRYITRPRLTNRRVDVFSKARAGRDGQGEGPGDIRVGLKGVAESPRTRCGAIARF